MLRIHKGFKYSLLHKQIIESDSRVLVPMPPHPPGIVRKDAWIASNQDLLSDMVDSVLDALYSIFQQEYNIDIDSVNQLISSLTTLAYNTSWNRIKAKQYLYE